MPTVTNEAQNLFGSEHRLSDEMTRTFIMLGDESGALKTKVIDASSAAAFRVEKESDIDAHFLLPGTESAKPIIDSAVSEARVMAMTSYLRLHTNGKKLAEQQLKLVDALIEYREAHALILNQLTKQEHELYSKICAESEKAAREVLVNSAAEKQIKAR